jgi:solute carrier family 25 (mitochondrial phosphate transporter), member 23/24/25/41
VSLSAEDMSVTPLRTAPHRLETLAVPVDYDSGDIDDDEDLSEHDVYPHEEEEHHDWFLGSTAVKFLLAGGIAGAG